MSGKNTDLPWNNFSSKEYIAELRPQKDGTIKFKWLGFYNNSSKKRVFTNNPFGGELSYEFLKKCELDD